MQINESILEINPANCCNKNPISNQCDSCVNSEAHGTLQCRICGLVYHAQTGEMYNYRHQEEQPAEQPNYNQAFTRPERRKHPR